MTNTEIIQAIKAEMERRWKHHRKNFVDREEDGDKMEEDAYLLQYLSDLEKSVKPMNHEGLQEEIVRTYHNGSVADTSDIDHVTYENIAEHFYELGKRSGDSEKPMNQDELVKENTDVGVLDKEFYRYLKIHGLFIQDGERITYYNGDTPNLLFDLKSIVCHFYNFGCKRTAEKYDEIEYKRQRAEESVCDELEEEIKTQVYNLFFDLDGIAIAGATAYATVDDMAYIARHFAQWGAEHLK